MTEKQKYKQIELKLRYNLLTSLKIKIKQTNTEIKLFPHVKVRPIRLPDQPLKEQYAFTAGERRLSTIRITSRKECVYPGIEPDPGISGTLIMPGKAPAQAILTDMAVCVSTG